MTQKRPHTDSHITTPPATIQRRRRAGAAFLVLLVALQFTITPHPAFTLDGYFWFYPLLGLLSCMGLVLFTRMLGRILKRPEEYWEDKDGK